MRVGKLSWAIVVATLFLGFLCGLFASIYWFIPNEHSFMFTIVWFPALLLGGLGFKFLQKKWPAIFSDTALTEGGPRLTLGRSALGISVLLLGSLVPIALFITYPLGKWQTAVVWAVTFGGVLWTLNSLEHRWLRHDRRSYPWTRNQ